MSRKKDNLNISRMFWQFKNFCSLVVAFNSSRCFSDGDSALCHHRVHHARERGGSRLWPLGSREDLLPCGDGRLDRILGLIDMC